MTKVIVVHLRRPSMDDPNETRSDPFWEFGSFGCTMCHSKNLLRPERADQLNGVRLAFAQGGWQGMKLVFLTPPIRVEKHGNCCEARWSPGLMPFRYDRGPLIINNGGETEIPSLRKELSGVNRSTWVGKFSSKYRSRTYPVSEEISKEMLSAYQKAALKGVKSLASSYVDALPEKPPKVDTDRRGTYESLVKSRLQRKCKHDRHRYCG